MGKSENRFTYDPQGRLIRVTLPEVVDPATGESVQPRYTYGHDRYGNQTSITDPLERETRFAFDSRGRQTSRTLPDGLTERTIYDDRSLLDVTAAGEPLELAEAGHRLAAVGAQVVEHAVELHAPHLAVGAEPGLGLSSHSGTLCCSWEEQPASRRVRCETLRGVALETHSGEGRGRVRRTEFRAEFRARRGAAGLVST